MDRRRAANGINFVQCIDSEISLYIMSFLDDPADVVRAASVSRFWREFVIRNGIAKQLCVKTFPQLSEIVSIVHFSKGMTNSAEIRLDNASEREILGRDHKVYASLHRAITKVIVKKICCLENAVSASSTNRFPEESVRNTLNPMDGFRYRTPYWSSKGESDPTVPETLVYKLKSGIWLITDIEIQPLEAFFEPGNPIYLARSVRFRLGHLKPLSEISSELGDIPLPEPADDKFRWTYTSPEFPMMQENGLQEFELPEPVLCIDGYLQIELLGRVQRRETDGLFYMCVSFVRVLGRSLYSAFDMDVLEPYGLKKLVLKHNPEDLAPLLASSPQKNILSSRQCKENWQSLELMIWSQFGRRRSNTPLFRVRDERFSDGQVD